MRSTVLAVMTCGVMAIVLTTMEPAARAQAQQGAPAATPAPADDDPVKTLVGRLDLEKYKATIKGSDAVRRSPSGHRSQPRGDRLDRGTAQELRVHEHRAHQVRVPAAGRARRDRGRGGTGGAARAGRGEDVVKAPRRRRTARRRARTRRPGRQHDLRESRPHRRQQRPERPTGPQAPRAEFAAEHARSARGGLLHQDRHDPARRNVHRRRPHGRHRLRRGRERRRLRHRARDGAGADLQQP